MPSAARSGQRGDPAYIVARRQPLVVNDPAAACREFAALHGTGAPSAIALCDRTNEFAPWLFLLALALLGVGLVME